MRCITFFVLLPSPKENNNELSLNLTPYNGAALCWPSRVAGNPILANTLRRSGQSDYTGPNMSPISMPRRNKSPDNCIHVLTPVYRKWYAENIAKGDGNGDWDLITQRAANAVITIGYKSIDNVEPKWACRAVFGGFCYTHLPPSRLLESNLIMSTEMVKLFSGGSDRAINLLSGLLFDVPKR